MISWHGKSVYSLNGKKIVPEYSCWFNYIIDFPEDGIDEKKIEWSMIMENIFLLNADVDWFIYHIWILVNEFYSTRIVC